jgi:hypothetical protein
MRKGILMFAVVASLLTMAGAVQAQQNGHASQALSHALDVYVQHASPRLDVDLQKSVPRTDKAEAALIGAVALVDDIHFLSSGTPFRIVIVSSNKPLFQLVPIVCLGSSSVVTCGRLVNGRRVSFTGDLLIDDDGLAIIVAKKLQT